MSSTLVNQQVGPNGVQPFSNQQNFGQVCGEIQSWVPHVPFPMIENAVNNAFKNYLDRRQWYGSLVKGILQSPGYYSQGTVSLTNGSNVIQGNNTSWPYALNGVNLIGMQIRLGFVYPVMTITGYNLTASPQTLTVDTTWMQPNLSNTSYFLNQMYYSIPNCKFVLSLRNLMMMTRIWTNVPSTTLDTWDPSRLQMYMPRVLATMPPDPSGNWVGEMWPAPNICQPFPYIAAVAFKNLVDDEDNFPAFTRCDIIKAKVLSDMILFRSKENPNYSENMCIQISERKRKEYEFELTKAEENDEALMRRDIVRADEMYPLPQLDWSTGMLSGGGFLAAMSSASAYEY